MDLGSILRQTTRKSIFTAVQGIVYTMSTHSRKHNRRLKIRTCTHE